MMTEPERCHAKLDRNSTNGIAVTTPDGRRTPRQPGVPAFASPGSTVHFGDRSFHLGQA
ncbi:MAG: hypothetical protein NVSMB43_10080 [Pseudarthrobacter sp.]